MSSMRSSKRPPVTRAMSSLMRALSAWPRCRYPSGLGAKRKTRGAIGPDEVGYARSFVVEASAPMSHFIHTQADLETATAPLIAADRRLAAAHALAGPLPLRRRPGGFEGLASIVVSQQLSTASAAAILGRLTAAIGRA